MNTTTSQKGFNEQTADALRGLQGLASLLLRVAEQIQKSEVLAAYAALAKSVVEAAGRLNVQNGVDGDPRRFVLGPVLPRASRAAPAGAGSVEG